jgi:lipoprotein-anchoring transpeptidase ErfK/SrfK
VKARIGVGKPGTATPVGRFYVRDRLIPADTDSVYGVFAFGTSAFSPTLTDWPGGGIVGVHGTNQPALIPGRISHGCVRVRNRKVLKLRRKMPLGTPIRIR